MHQLQLTLEPGPAGPDLGRDRLLMQTNLAALQNLKCFTALVT
jgi:hypothetical protein